jgi:hypothetical protein
MIKWNLNILAKLLQTVLNMISPELKDYIKNFIKELKDKAQATANPFDDLFVELLEMIFL